MGVGGDTNGEKLLRPKTHIAEADPYDIQAHSKWNTKEEIEKGGGGEIEREINNW